MAIKKLKNGTYQLDFRVSDKRIRQGGFPTKRSALVFLGGLKASLTAPSDEPTFAEVVDKYTKLETSKKSIDSQKNEPVYFKKLDHFLRSERGKVLLSQITLEDLQMYQAACRKHRKASTINRRFAAYNHFFEKCIDWGYLEASPSKRLKSLSEESKRRSIWTQAQIAEVISRLPLKQANLFKFIANTGARPQEAIKLKWRDVDLSRGLVALRTTKGGKGERVRYFPMNEVMASWMSSIRPIKVHSDDLVFPASGGEAFSRYTLQSSVRRVVLELGYGDLSVYGLRHTFVTTLTEMDVALPKIMKLAGHTKLTTTQRYVQIESENLREVTSKYIAGKGE